MPSCNKTIHQNINDPTVDMDKTIILDSYQISREKKVITTREVKNKRTTVHDQVRFIDWIPEIVMKYTIFIRTRSQSFY